MKKKTANKITALTLIFFYIAFLVAQLNILVASALVQPTISGFDNSTKTMNVGEIFNFAGTVSGNGGTLTTVTININRNRSSAPTDNTTYDSKSISSTSYSLSNFSSIKTGTGFMTQPGTYYIQVWAKNTGMTEGIKLSEKQITLVALPTKPVISKPLEGDVINKDSGKFRVSWSTTSTDCYYISVRKAGVTSSSVFNNGGNVVSTVSYIDIPTSCLDYGGSYYVFVTAQSPTGGTSTSVNVNFTVGPQVFSPTISGFDNSAKTMNVGDTFNFAGTVSGNGGTLTTVTININRNRSSAPADNTTYDSKNISSTSYSLSNFSSITTGTGFMTQPGTYYIQVWAKNTGMTEGIKLSEKQITLVALPTKPVISKPLEGDVINKDSGTFRVSWSTTSTDCYYISVRKAGVTTSSVFNNGGNVVSTVSYIDIPTSCLDYGGSYYVFVTAQSPTGVTNSSENVNFTVSEQSILPTINDYDASSENVVIGDKINFSGTINTKAGILDKVTIAVHGPDGSVAGGYYKEYYPATSTFDLSSIPALVAGTDMRGDGCDIDMTKPGVYLVDIYARNSINPGVTNIRKQITITNNTSPAVISIEGVLDTDSVILGDKVGFAITTNSLASGVEIQENGATSTNVEFKGMYSINSSSDSPKTFVYNYNPKSIGQKILSVYAKNGSLINSNQFKDYTISVCNDKIGTPKFTSFKNTIEVNQPLTLSWSAPTNTTPDSYTVGVFIEDPFSYKTSDVFHVDNITGTSITIPADVFSMSRDYKIYVEAYKKSWVKSDPDILTLDVVDTQTSPVLSVTPDSAVVNSLFTFSLVSPERLQSAFLVFDNPSNGNWLDKDTCRNTSSFRIYGSNFQVVNNKYVYKQAIKINTQGSGTNNYRKAKIVYMYLNSDEKESNEITFAVTPSLQPPLLQNGGTSNITSTSVMLSGKIVNTGGGTSITKWGFNRYLIKNGEHIYDNTYGSDTENIVLNADNTFTYTITNLKPSTSYGFMPFACNNNGVQNESQVFMDITTSKAAVITGNKITKGTTPYNTLTNQKKKQRTASLVRDPIDVATGAHMIEYNYLVQNSIVDLGITLSYNSLLLEAGTMGYGWSYNYETKLEKLSDGNICIHWDSNHSNTFIDAGNGIYKSSNSIDISSITQNVDGTYTLITQNKDNYMFNTQGVLLSIVDKSGRKLSFDYSNGYLTRITDIITGMHIDLSYTNNLVTGFTDGTNSISISYNNNLISSITDESGVIQTFAYNSDNRVLSSTKAGKIVFTNTYDEFGRVESQDDAVAGNGLTYFSYDDVSKPGYIITTITDRNGKSTKMVHDNQFRLVENIDESGNSTKYSYDVVGNVQNTSDTLDRSVGAAYDDNGNTTVVRDVAGNSDNYSYDNNSNLVSAVDSSGHKVKYEYNDKNLISKSVDELGNETLYSYNNNGQVLTVTYPNGGITTNEYDSKGMLISTTDPAGVKKSFTYDSLGNVLTESNIDGNTTIYAYDKKGNIIKIIDPLGNISEFTYDEYGNLLTSKSPNGKITTNEYNGNGKLIKTTDPYGKTIIYTYDGEDRLLTVTDKNGNISMNIYDEAGNISEKIDQNGNHTKYYYDTANRLVSEKDALGNVVLQNKYNAFDSITQTINGVGSIKNSTYNSLGLMTSSTDSMGNATAFSYDGKNRLTKSTDAINGVSSVTFDSMGNIITVSDPIGLSVTYSYDGAGRIVSKTTVNGNKISYAYNNKGQLVSSTNGRNQSIGSSYNAAGQLTMLTLPDGNKIQYTYDANGNVLTVKDNSGTISRTYDDVNRITSYTDASGNTISYQYDSNNNLDKLTYPDGKTVKYEYDKCNNLIKVTDWANRVTSYQYDADNRLTRTLRPNNTAQTLVYDNAGRITQQKDVLNSTGDVIYEANYTYDANGNITEESRTENQVTKTPEITQMTYNADNLLLTYNGKTIAYDADGNMLNAPLNGVMGNLTYDAQNRLLTAGNLSYIYDAEGNRIGIKDNSTGKVTKFIINSNANLSQVLVREQADGTKTYYIYGLGLIGEESQNNYLSYHYDYRGSTVALSDQNGVVTDRFSYDPYGEIIGKTGSTNTSFLFNGRDGVMVDENGLYYMRERYYNIKARRFVSMDILDGSIVDGGSLNKFAYVNGQPVNFIDPFGRSPNDSQSNIHNYHGLTKEEYDHYVRLLGKKGVKEVFDEIDRENYYASGNSNYYSNSVVSNNNFKYETTSYKIENNPFKGSVEGSIGNATFDNQYGNWTIKMAGAKAGYEYKPTSVSAEAYGYIGNVNYQSKDVDLPYGLSVNANVDAYAYKAGIEAKASPFGINGEIKTGPSISTKVQVKIKAFDSLNNQLQSLGYLR